MRWDQHCQWRKMNQVILYTDMTCQTEAVADLRGGGRGTCPPVQNLSISCSFWGNLPKLYVGAPLESWCPTSGKSWIRVLDYAVNVVKFMLYLSYLHMHSHTYTHTHRQTEQTHVTYLSVGPDFSGCTCCLSPATTWCTGCCCGFACCSDGRIFSYSLFVARRRLTSFQAQ